MDVNQLKQSGSSQTLTHVDLTKQVDPKNCVVNMSADTLNLVDNQSHHTQFILCPPLTYVPSNKT